MALHLLPIAAGTANSIFGMSYAKPDGYVVWPSQQEY